MFKRPLNCKTINYKFIKYLVLVNVTELMIYNFTELYLIILFNNNTM